MGIVPLITKTGIPLQSFDHFQSAAPGLIDDVSMVSFDSIFVAWTPQLRFWNKDTSMSNSCIPF